MDTQVVLDFQSKNGSKVRTADLHHPKMLHVGRMAGLVKLRRSDGQPGERQQWAGSADEGSRATSIYHRAAACPLRALLDQCCNLHERQL